MKLMNAKQVVEAIFDDLNERSNEIYINGFKNIFDYYSEDILQDMKNGWQEKVQEAMNTQSAFGTATLAEFVDKIRNNGFDSFGDVAYAANKLDY